MPTYVMSKAHANYPLGDIDKDGNYIYYGSYRPGAINEKITWETTTTYNVGLDFGFLRGRITGNLDYYTRVTDDLINVVDVPAGVNFKNRVISNIGSLTNQGIELSLNATVIQNKDFLWDAGFNFTHNINKITELTTGTGDNYYIPVGGISSGTGNNIQAHKVGYAANSFLVYETKKNEQGEWYFVDRAGNPDGSPDGQINANDLYMFHHLSPDYMLSFTSKFTYKKFDLGFSLRANIGNYVYNDVLASSMQYVEKGKFFSSKEGGFHNLLQKGYDIYWNDFKSDNPNLNSEWYLSDYFIEDASFLRCDNITLGYTFDISKVNLRVYATVQNPFVISGYKGLDPELNSGIDNNIYPRSMVTLLGVSVKF
jgi:iron complex outermembrane receptor protein